MAAACEATGSWGLSIAAEPFPHLLAQFKPRSQSGCSGAHLLPDQLPLQQPGIGSLRDPRDPRSRGPPAQVA
jgi:hypothetical protein